MVEYANELPARHKLLGLDEKHILKRAFRDMIPADILARPKQPYRAPDASSFFGEAAPDWVTDVLSPRAVAEAGVFNARMVEGLAAKCARTGGQNISNTDNMRIMAVLSTQLTHALFIRGAGITDEPPPQPMITIDLLGEQNG